MRKRPPVLLSTADKLATVEDIRNIAVQLTTLLRDGKIEPKQANPTIRGCALALHAAELSQSAAKMESERVRVDIQALQDIIKGYGSDTKKLRRAAQERLLTLLPRMGR